MPSTDKQTDRQADRLNVHLFQSIRSYYLSFYEKQSKLFLSHVILFISSYKFLLFVNISSNLLSVMMSLLMSFLMKNIPLEFEDDVVIDLQ